MLLLAAVLSCAALIAQSTGEVRGKVLDPNGEPLPMANVYVELAGGLFGTTTDMDGKFILKPLASGTYSVKISFAGYQPAVVHGVTVRPDRITFLVDHAMAMNDALGGKEFEVIHYKRPLIDPEEPGKVSLLASEMKHDPTRKNPIDFIGKAFVGVTPTANGDGLYFKGSRSENMVYFVDGVKVTGRLTGIAPDAVNSITVYTGGLPARYGDVTGGVIAIETKSYMDVYQDRMRRE